MGAYELEMAEAKRRSAGGTRCALCGRALKPNGVKEADGFRLCHFRNRNCHSAWTVHGDRPAPARTPPTVSGAPPASKDRSP